MGYFLDRPEVYCAQMALAVRGFSSFHLDDDIN